jgi:O-antigen/teichoic acid export membrane protein
MRTRSSSRDSPSGVVSTRQLAPIAAVSAATTIWLSVLGLLTTPFMLHTLGASAYAVFALITIITAYLSNLELGFGHTSLRFLARARAEGDADEETRIVATSLFIFTCAGALAAVTAFVGATTIVKSFAHFPRELEDDAVGAVRLAALLLVLTFLYSFAQVSLQALGRFRPLLWTRAIFGTLLAASAVGAAAVFDDVRAVLAAQVVISLFGCIVVFIALAGATTARLRPAFDRTTFRKMRGYGGLVLATGVAYQIMLQGPPTILAGDAPSAEVAAFAVPAVVLTQLTLLIAATSTGFLPFASAESAGDDHRRLSAVFRSHLRMTVTVLGPIVGFLVVFAGPLLTAWLGADFASQAADPLRFLALAGFVLAISAPPADVARGIGRPGWNLAYVIVAASLCIAAALAFVPDSGATGAALGLLIGLAIATPPFLCLVADRLLDLPPRRIGGAIAAPALAVLVACSLYWMGSLIISGLEGAAVMAVAVTPPYALAVFRFILDDAEQTTLRAGRETVTPLLRAVVRRLRAPLRHRTASIAGAQSDRGTGPD